MSVVYFCNEKKFAVIDYQLLTKNSYNIVFSF